MMIERQHEVSVRAAVAARLVPQPCRALVKYFAAALRSLSCAAFTLCAADMRPNYKSDLPDGDQLFLSLYRGS